jgi:class 3 adenylate cyclase/tetratricopeptide (TPR) repeat protein
MKKVDNLKSGERRVVTIMFSDMQGSTAMTEKMDPEEIDALMGSIFSAFESIIKGHGGMVEKYIGDALVAVFGHPELHEDDPSRAIVSALEFIDELKNQNDKLNTRGISISFRTGINTGLITTGRRGEFEVVTGHAMNVAQRLESEAPPNGVYVSESTREKCENDFTFTKRISLKLKGKTTSVSAYQVLGRASIESADSGPFIGRKEILDELLKDYMRNNYGEVSGFFLIGDAGMGKSRIISAFMEKIRKFPDFRTPILSARAQKYKTQRFAVVIDLILCYLDLSPAADPITLPDLFESRLDLPNQTALDFIDLAWRHDPAMDTRAVTVLYGVFAAILAKHSGDLYPIAVIIDNESHMDRQSRDFFQYFFKNGKIKPFFLLAGRELPQSLRETFAGLKYLKLDAFTNEESIEYIRRYWPENHDEKMTQLILSSSLGNPLFLREYIKFARENRDVSNLPMTVQNIFLTQIDRYDPEYRELLKKLSVFQHSFTLADAKYIQAKTESNPSVVERAVTFFMNEGILIHDDGEYLFKLDVFKKALYNSLLNYNKKIIHSLVADLVMKQKKPNLMRLIYHLIRSERYLEAIGIMQDDPNRNYNYDYLQFIDVLLRHIDKGDYASTISCLITKSAILFNSGHIEDAEGILKQIMEIAITQRNRAYAGFAYHQITAYNLISYGLEKAHFSGRKALEYYRATNWPTRGIVDVLKLLALSELLRNDVEESDRLIAELDAIGDADIHDVLEVKATHANLLGRYTEALAIIEKSLASLSPEDTVHYFFAMDLEIKVLWQLCEFAALKTEVRKMLALCANLNASVLSQANAMLGFACFATDEGEKAAECFYRAEFFADQIGNDYERIDALRTLALCRYMTGNIEKAEATARTGLTIGLRHSCFYPVFTLLVLQTEICAVRGDPEEARFFLGEAKFIVDFDALLPPRDEVLYRYFSAALGSGPSAEADRTKALELFEREKSRLEKPERIANFLTLRSFGRIEERR